MGRFCLILAVFPILAAAQAPVIDNGGVESAATNTTLSYIAPQMLVTIKGQHLAGFTESASGWPLPETLGGATVTFDGVAAPLLYASPVQINAQAPSSLVLRQGTIDGICSPTSVVVTTGAGSSAAYQVCVNFPAPGIFTQDASGCGQATAFNVHADGSLALNTPRSSLDPGKDLGLAIFLTGQGAFNGRMDGVPWTYDPSAYLPGGYGITPTLGYPGLTNEWDLTAQYAGPALGTAGIDQVNALGQWSGAPQGCHVPLYLVYPGVVSQLVDVSIQSGGGACSDPQGTLGVITWQQTTVSRTGATTTSAAITAQFIQSDGLGFWPPVPAPQGPYGPLTPVPAACDVSLPTTLDAGTLQVSGPSVGSVTVNPSTENGRQTYAVVTAPLQGGAYQVTGLGGAQVGAFNANGNIPAPIAIGSNLQPGTQLATDSNGGYTFTWTGGTDDSVVTAQFIWAGYYQGVASVSASAGSISVGDIVPVSGTGPCAIFCPPAIGIPRGQSVEVIFTQSPPQAPSLPFQAPGLGFGGELTWQYVWDFRNLSN
ncbi:MAG: hypothetical protein ABSH50_29070 [Bryobacteraceae bacterium]